MRAKERRGSVEGGPTEPRCRARKLGEGDMSSISRGLADHGCVSTTIREALKIPSPVEPRMTTQTLQIAGWHAHVYYDEGSRARAAAVREALDCRFRVKLGRWRDEPVGPHPEPMYQVAFKPDQFAGIVQWLMLNRDGLTVLVHPETGHDLGDHRDRALWMGRVLDLNLDVLG